MAIFNGLFLLAAILVKPDDGSIGHAFAAFSPFPRGSLNTLLLLIASTIGATVTPWMIFFQQSASADKGMTPSDVKHGRLPPSEPGWAPSSAAGPSSPGRRSPPTTARASKASPAPGSPQRSHAHRAAQWPPYSHLA